MADLRIRGLTKRYGSTLVLDGLDLTVHDGEFLTLLGASGCGKSTLLKLIAGLDSVDDGAIHQGGRDLLPLTPAERNCAMVFQSYALYPHMTVGENIRTPLLMRNLTFRQRLPGARLLSAGIRARHAEADAAARKVAASLGIEPLWQRKPAQLSGGQRQRVALARAMVRRPSVFLFDEPLSNLDANLRQVLREEIRQLHGTLGITFIYVTHDQHEAMSMSDRIALMKQGRILQLGSPRELYEAPASLEVARFVGAPRINVLEPTAGGQRLAFRPHQALPAAPGIDGLHLRSRIRGVEYAGSGLVLSVSVPGQSETLTLSLPVGAGGHAPGQDFDFVVPWSALHAFDADGNRLAPAATRLAVGTLAGGALAAGSAARAA